MGKGLPDSFDVDADVDVDAAITATTDMTADVEMATDSKVTMDSTTALDSKMAVDTTMRVPDVIRTAMDTVSRIAVTEPIRTEMQMDVKPVVLDLCLNLGINKLPRTDVRRPYHHCLRISVLGTELASISLGGYRDVIIDAPDPRPAVAWGGHRSVREPTASPAAPRPAPTVVAGPTGGGLRINLTG